MVYEWEQVQVWQRGIRACLIYEERDAKHRDSHDMFCGTQHFILGEGSGDPTLTFRLGAS